MANLQQLGHDQRSNLPADGTTPIEGEAGASSEQRKTNQNITIEEFTV